MFSPVCLYMILYLELLQFTNLDVTQEYIHEFSSYFVYSYYCKEHTACLHCVAIILYEWSYVLKQL